MSSGVKKILGVVVSIAAPFVAPAIAGAFGISSAIGTSLVGAGIGALGAKAAGGNPLLGAALGGFGTFAAQGGFGAARGAASATGMTTGTPLTSAAGNMPPVGAAPAPTAITGGGAVGGAVGGAAGAGGGIMGGLKSAFSGIMSNPMALGQLAMTVFGKSPQELTPLEQQRMKELEELAATDRGLFNQKVEESRKLLQQGEANPEQAFATAALTTQRGLNEADRQAGYSERPGLRTASRRRGAIESARVGTAAVAGENARAAQTKAAGISAMPSRAPDSASGLQLSIYSDLEKRRREYQTDLSNAFGNMYGSIA